MLIDQQNPHVLPSSKLLKRLFDLGHLRLRVYDEEVLAAVGRGSNVADAGEEHSRHGVLHRTFHISYVFLSSIEKRSRYLISNHGEKLAVFGG